MDISHEKLAKLVDYDRPNILNFEAGKKPIPDDLLERIAKELDLPYKRLIALKILDRVDDEVKGWMLMELQVAGQDLPGKSPSIDP